jgi:arylsulfatase A-like enzyme
MSKATRDLRPNVLFITFDQWRGDCLSSAGHPLLRTPHLDALAADGALFAQHFTNASPCAPARASLYSGLYLHNHRAVRNGMPLADRHTNIAREARKGGYDPVLFGFTDTAVDPRGLPASDPRLATFAGVLPGFSVGLDLPGDSHAWIDWLAARGHPRPPAETPRDIWLPKGGSPRQKVDAAPARYAAEESETAFLTDRVLAYIAGRASGDPWFIHLSYFRPHSPLVAPAPYNTLYDPADCPVPKRAANLAREKAQHPWLARHLDRQRAGPAPVQDRLPMATLDDAGVGQLRATYYGLIGELDDAIGRIVHQLKALNLYDRTLIAITSDHGDMLGDHWCWGAEGYFDQAFHVPLILHEPSSPPVRGVRIDRFTEAVDVMPTLLEAVGLPVPPECDGHSLLPLLRGGPAPDWRSAVQWEFDFRDLRAAGIGSDLELAPEHCRINVIRDADYKYVHFVGLPPLFFDLGRDPDELEDRANDPDYAGLRLDYTQRMLSWRLAHEDRTLSHLHLGPGGVHAIPAGRQSVAG